MLFRPPAEHRLDAARNLLDDWNAEADRFRRAAALAHAGELPSRALVEAAREVHDGLMELIADTDVALERLPPGHPDFGRLLQAQAMAIAINESVERSCDMLAAFGPVEGSAVQRVSHEAPAMN